MWVVGAAGTGKPLWHAPIVQWGAKDEISIYVVKVNFQKS
jgi:hypothetical protein